jgi:uncharacterized protein (TIGR02231 family)
MSWLVVGLAVAEAQELQEQAERLMNLDFSLDEIKAKVAKPARASAPPAADPASGYYDDPYGGVPPRYDPEPVPARLPLEPNSTLRSVTVFRDRALVTRFREVDLPKGVHSVQFEGLPWTLTEAGLTAGIEAGGARIVGVEVVSSSREVHEDDVALEEVRKEAEAKVDALGLVRDRIEALLAERQYLRTALVPPAATAGQSVGQVEAGLRFVSTTESRISRELRQQQDDAEELAEDLHPLLVKMEDPLASGQPVQVDVEVDAPGKVRLVLEYAVPGAGWSPAYNARLDPKTGVVDLDVYGVVQQRTAEDWTDAEILLSTANPAAPGTAEQLVPWALGRSGSAGAYHLESGTGATTGAPPAPSGGGVVGGEMTADVQRGGVVVLAIPGRRTIRGDGSPQRLPVGTQRLSATSSLLTVPKLEPAVSRQTRVKYDGKLPLLAGEVSTFVGRDFVGSRFLDTVIPGEALELAFGTDDRFRVTRELVERQSERVGRKSTRYTFRFKTTVLNHGDAAQAVSLVDQVPLAQDAGIEVDVTELTGGARDPVDGKVSWTLQVPAHGEVVVELAFSVVIPDELSYVANELNLML